MCHWSDEKLDNGVFIPMELAKAFGIKRVESFRNHFLSYADYHGIPY